MDAKKDCASFKILDNDNADDAEDRILPIQRRILPSPDGDLADLRTRSFVRFMEWFAD